MDKPVFGKKEQTAQYSPRYAAYIIVEKNQKLALIEAPNGAFFCLAENWKNLKRKKKHLGGNC